MLKRIAMTLVYLVSWAKRVQGINSLRPITKQHHANRLNN